jgi:hypothetical protein
LGVEVQVEGDQDEETGGGRDQRRPAGGRGLEWRGVGGWRLGLHRLFSLPYLQYMYMLSYFHYYVYVLPLLLQDSHGIQKINMVVQKPEFINR